MRILVLAQVVPNPPDSGPKIKTHGTVRALAVTHDVTVVAFSRSDDDERSARQLAAECGCVVRTVPLRRGRGRDLLAAGYALATGKSFILARDRRRSMHRIVRLTLDQTLFDVIHVDQLNMAQFVPPKFDGRVIFDAHNAVWQITDRLASHERSPLRRLVLRAEARRIRRAERRICRASDVVMTTTQEDQDALRRASGRPFAGAIIPIGVPVPAELREGGGTSPTLLHIGTMFYPPNADAVRWFVGEVFGRVRATVPDARFVIVGARPPADIRALDDPTRGIEVRGYVADIAPLLQEAAATVVPTRAGSGMRVKILEAMATGLPVVTTTVGAEGIAVTAGHHLLIADDAAAFAAATIDLLTDASLCARLRAAAYERAVERYDWDRTGAMVCALYERFSASPRAAHVDATAGDVRPFAADG